MAHSIACGGRYNLQVTALNVAGESDGTVSQILAGQEPTMPIYPRLTAISPFSALTLQWNHPLDDGCLPVRHHVVNRDGVDLPTLASADSNSFTDDISSAASFPLGTSITYKIKAVNDAGASAYSEPIVVTVGQPPNAPSSLVISRRISETSVELQWTADTPVAGNVATTSYRVYLDDLSGNMVVPQNVSTPEIIFSGLTLGASYSVSVSAVNSIGEGSQSSPVLVLHTGVVPSKMTGASAPLLNASTSLSITISWLPPSYNGGSSLTTYRVYHDIGQTGSFTMITLTDLSQTWMTLTSSSTGASSLTTGQIVDFYVTSVNVIGESPASDVLTLYVAGVPSQPTAPTESKVFALSSTTVGSNQLGI